MAAPTRTTPTLDVSPISADMMGAELWEHAENVKAAAEQNGTPRIAAARVRNIERFARQLDRIAAGADE